MIGVGSKGKATREGMNLAARLHIPHFAQGTPIPPEIQFLFFYEEGALFLGDLEEKFGKPFLVDYLSDEFYHRLETASKKDPLLKASGFEKGNRTFLDASYGLGYDSIFLASRGFGVTACERNPYVYEFAVDALVRLKDGGGISRNPPQIFLGSVAEYIKEYPAERFDTVYFDPMYPEAGGRSALAKKEMRIFRALVGDDIDAKELFPLLLSRAKNRLVIKRPDDAPSLVPESTRKVDIKFEGKSVRFDVYLVDLN